MAEANETSDATPQKRSRRPMLIGFVLAVLLAGAGFFATWSGLLLETSNGHETTGEKPGPLPNIAFVPVDPIIVSLGNSARNQHLRFTSQLEVEKGSASEVALLLPRILDVLNGYLRAVDVGQLENPSALVQIRAQMLRRIQIVTGEGRVRDLLITEFVLN
jgi:flagellar FliL protein